MGNSWADGPLCGFDLETTGVDTETARIVTAAVVASGRGRSEVIRQWLVDPGVEIPVGASAIHGITTERARSEGQPAAEAIFQIEAALNPLYSFAADVPLVIYNAPYDLTVLDRELRRYDPAYRPPKMPFVIDPLVLDKHLDRYRRGSRKLADTCRLYGVRLDDAHDATADTLAAVELARKLALRYPEIAVMTPAELHELQVKAKADQAASFQEHLRSKGSTEIINGSWPFIPYTGPVPSGPASP